MDDCEEIEMNSKPLVSDIARIVRYGVTAIGGYMVGKGYLHADTVEAAATIAATAAPVIVGIILARFNSPAMVAARRGAANVLGFRSPPQPAPLQDKVEYTYSQASGRFLNTDGVLLEAGYSGFGEGKNNPAMEAVKATGPIPRGLWKVGTSYHSARTGPITIPLYKLDSIPGDDIDQDSLRSAFRIHGDSKQKPGEASRGCIILSRKTREDIAHNPGAILLVTE